MESALKAILTYSTEQPTTLFLLSYWAGDEICF